MAKVQGRVAFGVVSGTLMAKAHGWLAFGVVSGAFMSETSPKTGSFWRCVWNIYVRNEPMDGQLLALCLEHLWQKPKDGQLLALCLEHLWLYLFS